jgi:hypothetical protein
MIKALRKGHLQIWILWAVLLPVGIIAARMAVPKKATQELLQEDDQKSSTIEFSSAEKKNYKMSIVIDTTKKESAVDFSVTTNEEFKKRSLLLYRFTDTTTNNIDKQQILGRIEGAGTFNFPLPYLEVITCFEISKRIKFILYDITEKQTIDTLIFNPTRTGIIL